MVTDFGDPHQPLNHNLRPHLLFLWTFCLFVCFYAFALSPSPPSISFSVARCRSSSSAPGGKVDEDGDASGDSPDLPLASPITPQPSPPPSWLRLQSPRPVPLAEVEFAPIPSTPPTTPAPLLPYAVPGPSPSLSPSSPPSPPLTPSCFRPVAPSVSARAHRPPLPVYASSSPDEEALTSCAAHLGVVLTARDDVSMTLRLSLGNNIQSVAESDAKEEKEEEKWEILQTLPFTSERKRMSVLVRHQHRSVGQSNNNNNNTINSSGSMEDVGAENGQIQLLIKGADEVIMPRLASTPHSNQARAHAQSGLSLFSVFLFFLSVVILILSLFLPSSPLDCYSCVFRSLFHSFSSPVPLPALFVLLCFLPSVLDSYASSGLRTLCVAMRSVSAEQYHRWLKVFEQANTALQNREVCPFLSFCLLCLIDSLPLLHTDADVSL